MQQVNYNNKQLQNIRKHLQTCKDPSRANHKTIESQLHTHMHAHTLRCTHTRSLDRPWVSQTSPPKLCVSTKVLTKGGLWEYSYLGCMQVWSTMSM